ncbi:RHS repeat domain-containing protein [Phaeodactylibacter luteus]|uniref:RHS repeat-associated core domain-containing protein n=1 Tax=Phaeodactylibacter luteus TaxID=1564516 RepID=A0A5C6RFI3_9BACT|nr:RHS repeat-associated core domain-containing protein [Phaeodactylibacter luteus]TXB59448.1 RHS repeat-associated core domain-containing protein [Phaeodactylibacter luteus]
MKSSRSHRTLSEAGCPLTDHLGNTTVLFRDADEDGQIAAEGSGPAAAEVMQRLWYYPFGLQLQGIGRDESAPAHLYRYNGKAWDPASGLSDYGARWYDAGSGRWSGVDPLADDAMQIDKSPYQYAWNNPVYYTDPDGRCPWCIGAIVGAAVDYGAQVAGNLAEGKGLGDALTDVDGTSILVSAGAGAVGGGLVSGATKLIKGAKTVNKASQLAKNAKKGAQFEQKVLKKVSKTQSDVVEQITVKTKSGTRTRLDIVGKDKATGKVKLTEAKSSKKAPLTKNQKKAFPEIQKDGGTVVGKGKGNFPGGTKIPPTKVDIIRPKK